jgi:hypothetical protein
VKEENEGRNDREVQKEEEKGRGTSSLISRARMGRGRFRVGNLDVRWRKEGRRGGGGGREKEGRKGGRKEWRERRTGRRKDPSFQGKGESRWGGWSVIYREVPLLL